MAFNQNSFANFTNNNIVEFINTINQGLNENLEIADTRRYRGGARLRNIRTLVNYLNQHNAQQIINPNFNDNDFLENLDNFIIHEQESRSRLLNESYERNYENLSKRESFYEDEPTESDIEYFNKRQSQINQDFANKRNEQNYNENIANRESFYDNELDEENIQYFERQAEIENAIKRAYEAVDNAINLINKSKPTLKKIDPKLIKDKSHLLEYYVPENEELYEYLDKFNHKFVSKNNDFLIVNEPYNLDEAVEVWKHYNSFPSSKVVNRIDDNCPIITYYFNQISSLENIYESLQEVFSKEIKPFKLHFQLSGVFETPKFDFENDVELCEYEAKNIIWKNYRESIPTLIQLPQDIEIVKLYIESVLHSYETTQSNTKLTIVGSIAFTISRMIKITGKINGLPDIFTKSRSIIVDNVDDNLCWYRAVSICLNPKLISATEKRRTQFAKQMLLKKYGIEYSNHMTNNEREKSNKILIEFKGLDIYEMQSEAEEMKLNINIYDYIESINQYNITNQWKYNDSNDFHSMLLFSKGNILHIMYIKPDGVETLTNILICPKCHSYSTQKKHKSYLLKHMKICDGTFKKNFIPNKEPLPFCPHILNNPVYEYCLAHQLNWKPSIYYMTYDFETMEQVVEKSIGKSVIINSRLIPLSVASCIKSANGLTTKHFDIRTENFIPNWIKWLFDMSISLYNDKINYTKSILKINSVKELLKIDKNLNVITVFGFNSSRFDSNLFKNYFNYHFGTLSWYATDLIGTASSLKQFVLISPNYETKLRFIDAQSFVAGGTLKQFGIDFGGETNSVTTSSSSLKSEKGVFPYEVINSNNYNEVLSKSEPFAYNDFYSYLNQSNPLSKDEYQTYLDDAKNYKSRWDYLLKYNDNDVEMMIKPIDYLIELNAQYNVDLISNLSLSKNASCIKYALAYKDFNPNGNYNVIHNLTTFVPDEQWWKYKCSNYFDQDSKYNTKLQNKINSLSKKSVLTDNDRTKIESWTSKMRDLSKCISQSDFKEFMKRYENENFCYLCGEHFTYQNKPTLDRIDNNIGHELNNCKFACAECNCLRNRNDECVTRLRIQLKKFCSENHLPTLINDEDEYHSIRKAITGGISNVLHRMNLRGITNINKYRYDAINNKIISYDTEYVMTHVVGIDFNSLYPSSFGSIKHSFNKYHGGIMYMPGRYLNRYNVYDENGAKNNKIYDICYKIITSKTRFDKNIPDKLFYAEVKLSCPKSKINYFINFPPVFRSINIKNNKEIIGTYMYDYMKSNKLASIDKEERKLTMILDTHGEYMVFSNYYLWFLLDHGLIIEDIKSVSLYECHNGFNNFVTEFMKKRQNILSGRESGSEKFYKMCLNGSYGYDGMNTEKYSKIKICDKNQTYRAIISDSYMNGAKLNDDNYLVQSNPKHYRCTTCLQESLWTLDNSKYWYLTFYYDFMNKCLDMNRIHVNTCETDSFYFSVAGNPNEPINQEFKYVIKNKEFYDKHVYEFMPNPNINTVDDTKKLLGCCVEKYAENQVALCPKCYTLWSENITKSIKLKGLSLKKNNINKDDYIDAIINGTIKLGNNINLQMNNNQMSKVTTKKIAVNATHTKMITLSNQSCVPFIFGLSANDVIVNNMN